MKALICDWCRERIVPGERFTQVQTQDYVYVSDGGLAEGDETTLHLHSEKTAQNLTCYQHYFM